MRHHIRNKKQYRRNSGNLDETILRVKAKHAYARLGSKRKVAEELGISYWAIIKLLKGYKRPTFLEAKAIIAKTGKKAGITTADTYGKAKEWRNQHNLPRSPHQVYKDWVGWDDYLGKPNSKNRNWPNFQEAKSIISKKGKKAGIVGAFTYQKAKKWRARHNLPFSPDEVYAKQGWVGWGDYLGKNHETAGIDKPQRPTFLEAKTIIAKAGKKLGIISKKAYENAKKWRAQHNLPRAASQVYAKHGWAGWDHFLGKQKSKNKTWPSFQKAKSIIAKEGKKAGIVGGVAYRNAKEWRNQHNLPCSPNQVYAKQGWIGWDDYLGKNYETMSTAERQAVDTERSQRLNKAWITRRKP